ncbi:MAG: hypothetical protein QOI06_3063 [Nocardioidaceae bacterium]|jgi:hypothetical protein|nr:hypothetical protein [Nocardioidaceae bacterium]
MKIFREEGLTDTAGIGVVWRLNGLVRGGVARRALPDAG